MPTTYSVAELRKQLLANGYTPLANKGKMTLLKGWPKLEVTPALIDEWSRKHSRLKDTGIRVENGLCVIDLDINHPLADDILDAAERRWPQLRKGLVRYGKGRKLALFCRTTEPFTRLHTRRWLTPGADLDKDGSHVVEIFGGQSPRQFGSFGAHTRSESGEVLVAYEWALEEEGGEELSPLTVPLEALPEIDKEIAYAFVDMAEEMMAAAGWSHIDRTTRGESEATRVYDLVDEMRFETNTGDADVPFQELRERRGEDDLRVSASFIEPGAGHSLTRCLVGTSHTGEITIWDSATGITHLPASASPLDAEQRQLDADAIAAKLRRLAEQEEEKKAKRRAKLSAEDDYQVAAAKLLQTYALCPQQQLQVVPIWATSTAEGMTLTNFRTMMLPWCGTEIGPRGGEKKINPVDLWAASSERVTVEGLRMRPDMARPTFSEHGKRYVNTYTPELHAEAGGDAWGGVALLEQVLPDPGERAWFTKAFAHKVLHPEVPGPAILMVARQFGTGRSTLGELVKLVFGARYVSTIGFDHFAGRTYQSQYTAWQADALVVLVNESSTADNGSQYRTKHDTYERLKEIVDPRPMERTIVTHGKPAFKSMVFATYFIFTNNPDALPLPAEDRRFWVGINGEPREAAFWDGINAWMRTPANVAAFVRWLEQVDLADFDPYETPPMTSGKRAMIEMAGSPIDQALAEALENLPSEVLIPEQIVHAMSAAKETWGLELPDRWQQIAKRAIQARMYRVGEKDGPSWVLRVEGKKYPLYARTPQAMRKWTNGGGADLRAEVLRSGMPSSQTSVAAALSKLKLAVDNVPSGGTIGGTSK